MSVELRNSLSIAMCSEHYLILSIDVQLICFVKSAVRFMDLMHGDYNQFMHHVINFNTLCISQSSLFNFFYGQCRVLNYC